MLKYWHSSKESAFIGNVGDTGDVGYIPGSERSLGGGNSSLSIHAWTEEPGGLQVVASQSWI